MGQKFVFELLGVFIMGCLATAFAEENKKMPLTVQSSKTSNPYASPKDIETGARVFRMHCATCHGRTAQGGRGPNLARGVFRHGSGDRVIFGNILNGIRGTGMPGVQVADTKIWQVLGFIRSLSQHHVEEDIPGNPVAGRKVYIEKGCQQCHWIDGEGGRLGSDLSSIGWIRSPEFLKQSLLEPSAVIEAAYRPIRLTLNEGGEANGLLLNENTYSIQMIDIEGILRSIDKNDIETITRPEISTMPSYEGQLTDKELDDLVAYQYSLRSQ